ncbi:MAG: hypothetical protein FJ146_02760 [Deltaproteobacteria bacterium]|nr:hypothetical protein [Deltaproteobacteria bacterium]
METLAQLSIFPRLQRWFNQQAQMPPGLEKLPDFLVWRLCDAIHSVESVGIRRWLDAFRLFLQKSKNPLQDFLLAEELADSHGAQMMELVGLIAEQSVRKNQGDQFFEAMKSGADSTRLAVFRFFAAWTALNTGRLEYCIAECEKVDQPFAPLYTLHGQALLELGRCTEAVEVLEIATRLSGSETIAWFQLAKARHISGDPERAFVALRQCRELSPNNFEVSLYMALVALENNVPLALAQEAFEVGAKLMTAFSENPTVVFTLLRLACRTGRKPDAVKIMNQAKWVGMSTKSDLVRALPQVLRGLHDVGWLDLASTLLGGITPAI